MNNFYNADKYFLVDTIHGNLKASNINLVPLSNALINLYNRRTFKVLSKKRIVDEITGKESFLPIESLGFLHTSDSPYQDDLDVISYEVLKLLGINAMPAFHLLTQEKLRGSILISALNLSDEVYTIEDLSKKIVLMIKENKSAIPEFLLSYIHLGSNSKNSPIMDMKVVKELIDFPINIISYVFNLDSKALYKIKLNYINYLLGMYVINQNNIELNTYGIYKSKTSSIVSMLPAYNYSKTLEKSNIVNLNNKYVDKEVFLNTLFNGYYEFFKDISRGLMENVSAYKKSMSLIIDNNTSGRDAKVITDILFGLIDNVAGLEEEHRLSFGESRIDMALTQTSINLNAVNHNQEVRNKYEKVEQHYKVTGDISPKDDIGEEKQKSFEKELVKVKVEEAKPVKKGHLGSIILAIIIIAIIIAIGFVTYYLMTKYIDLFLIIFMLKLN